MIFHDFRQMMDYLNSLDFSFVECRYSDFKWKGRNTYSFNRIFFVLGGGGSVTSRTPDETLILRPRMTYFMPLRKDLTFDFSGGIRLISLHFNASVMPGFDIFEHARQCAEMKSPPETKDFFRQAEASAEEFNAFCLLNMMIWRVFMKTGTALSLDFESVKQLNAQYGKLLGYIQENLSASLGIEELAEVQGWARDTLSRNFSRDFKMTLKSFLMKELVRKAEQHLIFSKQPIREIAEKLKFSSEYYFSNFFRREKKVSPSEFRELHFRYESATGSEHIKFINTGISKETC